MVFDMVSRGILLQKLHHYGVCGVVYNLLKSYLTRRKQLLCIDGSYSTTITMQFDFPQGSTSVLYFFPFMSTIFSTFLILLLCLNASVLYADDTCLMFIRQSFKKKRCRNLNELQSQNS